MTRSFVLAAFSAAAMLTAGAASASPLTQGSPSLQGGVGKTDVFATALPKMTKKQRELRAEYRTLQSEVRAAMRRNGGTLPEADRVVFQQRLEDLNQAMKQAG